MYKTLKVSTMEIDEDTLESIYTSTGEEYSGTSHI